MVDTERYAASFAMLDKDGDGLVSLEELATYMSGAAAPPRDS